VAVVGSGLAGLTTALLLRKTHHVTLYESFDRFGGEARGERLDGRWVDSGVATHHPQRHRILSRLVEELDLTTSPVEKSFGVACASCGLEYADGPRGQGLYAQPRRVVDRRFRTMLREIDRFRELAGETVRSMEDRSGESVGEFLARGNFSDYFLHHHLQPLMACVAEALPAEGLTVSAEHLVELLDDRGLVTLRQGEKWVTIDGGSRALVSAITALVRDTLRSTRVDSISRLADAGVCLRDEHGGEYRYDAVVVALHADQALALLADPTEDEREILGSFGYHYSRVRLHTNAAVLPRNESARGAINVRVGNCTGSSPEPTVTAILNLTQNLPGTVPLLRTSGPAEVGEHVEVARQIPIVTHSAVRTRNLVRELWTESTVFAGAYQGWGLHEDACRSGVAAATHLGATW
jgi:predicted NAD/FAD-binding protein